MVDLDDLKSCDLATGLDTRQLQAMRPLCEERKFPQGAVIFREGDKAEKLFVLLEGAVVINLPRESQPSIQLSSVAVGGSFGWSALVAPNRYTTQAEAVTACRLLAIDADGLHDLMRQEPTIVFNIMQHLIGVLSSRMKDMRLQMVEMLEVIDSLREGASRA